ncbi:MAG: hypothetical protein IPM43_05545 [Actinomycetota bacterium]|nr:MAG: hypothetical protein IPM43_05545 [Actinomycetota bacterium]
MNQVRNRLAALSLLDRAFNALSDDELTSLLDALEEDAADAVDHIARWRADEAPADGTEPATASRLAAVRSAAQRGRMNGDLERIALVVSDRCLADCIEQLGEASDNPSEDELQRVIPGLVERHGLATTRLMLASVVTGEAVAAPLLTRLLKHDDVVKLPPAEQRPVAPEPRIDAADDAERERLRAERKARHQADRDAARARREQAAAAKRKR